MLPLNNKLYYILFINIFIYSIYSIYFFINTKVSNRGNLDLKYQHNIFLVSDSSLCCFYQVQWAWKNRVLHLDGKSSVHQCSSFGATHCSFLEFCRFALRQSARSSYKKQNECQETQIRHIGVHTSTGENIRRGSDAESNSKWLKATVFVKTLDHVSVSCINQKSLYVKYWLLADKSQRKRIDY